MSSIREQLSDAIANTPEPILEEVLSYLEYLKTKRGLVERKTRQVHALKGVSFSLDRGKLLGYIGPNGSGKSTAILITKDREIDLHLYGLVSKYEPELNV